MATFVLCETEATDTAHGLPVCAGHHEAYIQENKGYAMRTEMALAESGPVTMAILLIALEELEQRMDQADSSSHSPPAAHTNKQ